MCEIRAQKIANIANDIPLAEVSANKRATFFALAGAEAMAQ
jgi:hypothetical protein